MIYLFLFLFFGEHSVVLLIADLLADSLFKCRFMNFSSSAHLSSHGSPKVL